MSEEDAEDDIGNSYEYNKQHVVNSIVESVNKSMIVSQYANNIHSTKNIKKIYIAELGLRKINNIKENVFYFLVGKLACMPPPSLPPPLFRQCDAHGPPIGVGREKNWFKN